MPKTLYFALLGFLFAQSACIQISVMNADGDSTLSTVQAPSGLSYSAATSVYLVGSVITENLASISGGTPSVFSVNPSLPAGLTLDSESGSINGTPTTITALATYTVTASNAGGSTQALLTITVNPPAPTSLTYAVTDTLYLTNSPITANTPTAGGTITSYSVTPALPTGLSLHPTSGVISGTPTAHQTTWSSYVVTGTNPTGSISTTLRLRTAHGFLINDTGDATDATPGDSMCATASSKCTLRAAIAEIIALGGGNRVALIPSDTAITVASTLTLSKAVDIVGASNKKSIVDGGGTVRVFEQSIAAPLTMEKVTIRNGKVAGAGAAINVTAGAGTVLNLTDMILKSNQTNSS
jgi:hypothetical protein